MSESLLLPLRPVTVKDSRADSLPFQIEQINFQRGSFRHVTEDSLLEEIKLRKSREGDVQDDEEKEKDSTDEARSRQEKLFRGREEMMKQLAQAQNDALQALDFVSLLLSKQTPRQGEMTMSPLLKQHVPSGSLGSDVVKTPQTSSTERRKIELVSRGWKLEAFNSAADKLLGASSRLEEEVSHETRYWEQVLAVKEKGWAICSLPQEKHTMCVQLGFREAAPAFRNRGLAALRRREDGELTLDQGAMPHHPKAILVQIRQAGQIVGTSDVPTLAPDIETSIEDRIRQARNALFEEELFHELNREARVLANLGVETTKDRVRYKSTEDQRVFIHLVDLEEETEMRDLGPQDILAKSIATSLRLLLSYAHRQNLHQRSQAPAPLTAKKRNLPEYSLLRPILNHLRHTSVLQSMTTFLNNLLASMKSAALTSYYTMSEHFGNLDNLISVKENSYPAAERFIDTLMAPLESTITLTLPSTRTFQLNIRTIVLPPVFGTEYMITNIQFDVASLTIPRLTTLDEVKEFILHLYTLDLVSVTASFAKDGKNNAEEGVAAHQKDQANWEVTSPHSGALTIVFPNVGRSKKMVISVEPERFQVAVGRSGINGVVGEKAGDENFVWKASGIENSQQTTLADVIREVGKPE